MIATDTPVINEINNYKMHTAKVVKRKLVTEVIGMVESNNINDPEEFDTYSLHDLDTSVGTETFSDNDAGDFSRLYSTKLSHMQ